jgi:hypothetical protein
VIRGTWIDPDRPLAEQHAAKPDVPDILMRDGLTDRPGIKPGDVFPDGLEDARRGPIGPDETIDAPTLDLPKGGWSRAIMEAKFFWRRRAKAGEEPLMVLVMDEATGRALLHEIHAPTQIYDLWTKHLDKRGPLPPEITFYGMPVWILPCMRGFIVLRDPPWRD